MAAKDSAYKAFSAQAQAAVPADSNVLQPQPGFQYKFLSSQADIVIGGGSAGGGKTYALLMECARFMSVPNMSAIIFRRKTTEITTPGGLWDDAKKIYTATVGGQGRGVPKTWHFPLQSGQPPGQHARVVFTHLQYDDTVMDHHGGQYPLICFDELTTFTSNQFFYLLTRNRTTIGIKPYVRCTTNPQTQGWVKDLISWWIYPDDHPDKSLAGYPIPERDGQLRYFVKDEDVLVWGDSVQEVVEQVPWLQNAQDGIPAEKKVKSLTFIAGSVYENKRLLQSDPGYIGNLMSQTTEVRNMLLGGCWRHVPGMDDLYQYDAVRDLWQNDFVPEAQARNVRYITADIAMQGSDLFVLCLWNDWRLAKVETYAKTDGPAIINAIKSMANRYAVPNRNISYDRDGVGDFLAGFLPGSFGFRAGASPLAPGKGQRPNYENLKTQLAYMMAEQVALARMYIEPGAMDDWVRERLVEEMMAHKKVEMDKDKQQKMTRKETVKRILKRSPDVFEALIQRAVFELIHSKNKRRSRTR